MNAFAVAAVAVLVVSTASLSWAQPPSSSRSTREVSASIGTGHVFRYADETFGDRPNVGASVGIAHRSGIGLEAELTRTLGLSLKAAICTIEGTTCYNGLTHYGVRSAVTASLVVQYRFGRRRVRPYVLGGAGVLWSKGLRRSDTGIGIDLGAGLKVSLPGNVSISPEIRWLDAPWLSRQNLAVTRMGVRIGYAW